MKKTILDQETISLFDFSGTYIGFVIDNIDFENDFYVKIFIPELFGYKFNTDISNLPNKTVTDLSKIINRNDLNVTTDLYKTNYIICRPLMFNGYTNKDEFIKVHKPLINERVLVKFLNNNPKNPYFINMKILTDNEELTLDEEINNNTGNIIREEVEWVIKK